jgi:hypothetical protein
MKALLVEHRHQVIDRRPQRRPLRAMPRLELGVVAEADHAAQARDTALHLRSANPVPVRSTTHPAMVAR